VLSACFAETAQDSLTSPAGKKSALPALKARKPICQATASILIGPQLTNCGISKQVRENQVFGLGFVHASSGPASAVAVITKVCNAP
jgi:hypothetical protein